MDIEYESITSKASLSFSAGTGGRHACEPTRKTGFLALLKISIACWTLIKINKVRI